MLNIARGSAERGLRVHLVLARAAGPWLSEIPRTVRLVDLRSPRVLASLPRLVRYFRQDRPAALLTALDHANVVALWARRLAGIPPRVVVSTRALLSRTGQGAALTRNRLLPLAVRHCYPWADAIVAVSRGVADDLARTARIPRARIRVICNPVVTPQLLEKGKDPAPHPWFAPGSRPVILGVGRLARSKDFGVLIRAFARVRQRQTTRLVILGEGPERARLEAVVASLQMGDDVLLPGFVANPYAYMARAAVVVLSSVSEGSPNVLVEAMALGTPVVSTDCPSGPLEIVEAGRFGALVPVGDTEALAEAILDTLERPTSSAALQQHALDRFSLDRSLAEYLEVWCPWAAVGT